MYCRFCGCEIDDESIFCKNCGKRLIEEEVVVDSETSTQIVSQDNVLLEEEIIETQDLVENEQVTDNDEYEEVNNIDDEDNEVVKKVCFFNKVNKKYAIIIGCALVLLLIVVGIIGGNDNKEEQVFGCAFVKESGEMFYNTNAFEVPLLLTETAFRGDAEGKLFLNNVKRSDNQEYVAYLADYNENFQGKLYYYPTDVLKKDVNDEKRQPVFVEDYVYLFEFVGNDYLIYIACHSDDTSIGGKLCLIDLKTQEVKEIYSDNVSNFEISKDKSKLLIQKSVIYNNVATGNSDIYLLDFNNIPDNVDAVQRVDSNISAIHIKSVDFKEIIYTKKDGEDADIVKYTQDSNGSGTNEILAENITNVLGVDDENNIYYTKNTKIDIPTEEIFIDDMKESDESIFNPDEKPDDYYYIEEEFEYTDFWTGETYIMTESYFDYLTYEADWFEYQEKLNRDSIRSFVSELSYYTNSLSLYCYGDEHETELATNVSQICELNNKTGKVIYTETNRESLKPVKMSEIIDTTQIPGYFGNWEETQEGLDIQIDYSEFDCDYNYYWVSKNTSSTLIMDEKLSEHEKIISTNGDKFYYLYFENGKETGELYEINTPAGKQSATNRIKSSVKDFYYDDKTDNLLYFIDSGKYGDNIGEVYSFVNGESELIGDQINFSAYWGSDIFLGKEFFVIDSNKYIFLDKYDANNESGELILYNNGEKVVVDTNVNKYVYFADDEIYLAKNLIKERDAFDLYKYNSLQTEKDENKSTLIDNNVSRFARVY